MKRFLDGLIFGSGFALAFCIVLLLLMSFVLPTVFNYKQSHITENEISTTPSIDEKQGYLGSSQSMSGKFEKEGTLAKGSGLIVGHVFVNNKPIAGVKLRLGLNHSVMSSWAISNARGEYQISVPYGKYVISGFELNGQAADTVLSGKIDLPYRNYSTNAFDVSDTKNGLGPTLKFVDPIIKNIQQSEYLVTDQIRLDWQPYPGAMQYDVQIMEHKEPNTWSNESLFKWEDRPTVYENFIKLSDYPIKLKPGHYYSLQVYAGNSQREYISSTVQTYSGTDFKVIE